MRRESRFPWMMPALGWILCVVGVGIIGHRVRSPEPTGYQGQYDSAIRRAANRHMPQGWDWHIFKCLVRQESVFQPDAKSRVGAIGLCQIMPATGQGMGLTLEDLHSPLVNLDGGACYLRWLWDQFPDLDDLPNDWQRTRFALAAYNGGIGRVQSIRAKERSVNTWAQLKPLLPEETQTYVTRIMDSYLPQYRLVAHRRYPGIRSKVSGPLRAVRGEWWTPL